MEYQQKRLMRHVSHLKQMARGRSALLMRLGLFIALVCPHAGSNSEPARGNRDYPRRQAQFLFETVWVVLLILYLSYSLRVLSPFGKARGIAFRHRSSTGTILSSVVPSDLRTQE